MSKNPVLHMFCGKIAAGKSTLARQLAREESAILISEDAWLGALFADQMTTAADYMRCSTKLQNIMKPHVVSLVEAGVSVVLDFPANTRDTRLWLRKILDGSKALHQMHVLSVPDEVCLSRLHARNAEGDHPFAATETQFHQFSKFFTTPSPEEGFTIVMHEETVR